MNTRILFLSLVTFFTVSFNLVGYAASDADIALRKAILNGDGATAQQAINDGADVNYVEQDYSDNPLGIAINNESLPMAELLLKNGANPNIYIDANGVFNSTPLIKAISRQNSDIVKLLVESGADVNLPAHKYFDPQNLGVSPLIQSIISPYTNQTMIIFNYLLSKGANVNQKTSYGYTALMATAHGKFSVYKQQSMMVMAEELLKRGADSKVRSNDDKTALDYAMDGKFSRMIELLTPKVVKK